MIKSPVLGTHSYDAPSSHHPRTPFLRRKSRKENGNSRYVVTPTRATTAMRPRSRRLYTQRCTGGPESDDVDDDDADDDARRSVAELDRASAGGAIATGVTVRRGVARRRRLGRCAPRVAARGICLDGDAAGE